MTDYVRWGTPKRFKDLRVRECPQCTHRLGRPVWTLDVLRRTECPKCGGPLTKKTIKVSDPPGIEIEYPVRPAPKLMGAADRKCAQCGKTYQPQSPNQNCCSERCYIKWVRGEK